MLLNDSQIQDLIAQDELQIDDFNTETQVTATGIDLTVGPDYKHPGTGTVFNTESPNKNYIELKPNEFYQVHTVESLQMPTYLRGDMEEVASLATKGISVTTGPIQPGWEGQLLLGVQNTTGKTIYLDPYQNITHVSFTQLDSDVETAYGDKDDPEYQGRSGV